MAKRKQSSKRRQARHKRQGKSSQFDKRQRLNTVNPRRKKTSRAKVPLVGALAAKVSSMSRLLDARMAFRLSIVMAGMMLADDRRVAAAWFTAAGVQDDWDRFYDCLISVGRNTQPLALPLLKAVLQKFDPGPDGHLTAVIDDSPTQRYGRHVEGAGVHHNPTPGPADGEWLYGQHGFRAAARCPSQFFPNVARDLNNLAQLLQDTNRLAQADPQMTADRFDDSLQTLRQRTPFRPFTIELISGDRFEVDYPDALVVREGIAVFIAPGGVPRLCYHESVSQLIADSNSESTAE